MVEERCKFFPESRVTNQKTRNLGMTNTAQSYRCLPCSEIFGQVTSLLLRLFQWTYKLRQKKTITRVRCTSKMTKFGTMLTHSTAILIQGDYKRNDGL
jgi:hypothetical protein